MEQRKQNYTKNVKKKGKRLNMQKKRGRWVTTQKPQYSAGGVAQAECPTNMGEALI
jgi:hypothetical protein